jgi:hypothetical protein
MTYLYLSILIIATLGYLIINKSYEFMKARGDSFLSRILVIITMVIFSVSIMAVARILITKMGLLD